MRGAAREARDACARKRHRVAARARIARTVDVREQRRLPLRLSDARRDARVTVQYSYVTVQFHWDPTAYRVLYGQSESHD